MWRSFSGEAGIPPDKLAVMMTGITGAHILSTATSRKPIAHSFATFSDFVPWMPVKVG